VKLGLARRERDALIYVAIVDRLHAETQKARGAGGAGEIGDVRRRADADAGRRVRQILPRRCRGDRQARERRQPRADQLTRRAGASDRFNRLRIPNVTAQTRIVSGARNRPDSRKFERLPAKMHVEADVGTGVSAKTVGELRKVTTWSENLVITTPHERHPESAVKIIKASVATRTSPKP